MSVFAKAVRISTLAAFVACTVVWTLILGSVQTVADSYSVTEESGVEFGGYISAEPCDSSACSTADGSQFTQTELRLFGIFPIKTVSVSKSESVEVVPGGIPFGIKMLSDGVMIADTCKVLSEGKTYNPAGAAGLKASDVIVSINGKITQTNSDVISAVSQSGGKPMAFCVRESGGEEKTVKITAVRDSTDGVFKIGVYVRDSSAGIGTITFYNPQTGVFGGLGHPVCDSSGDMITLLKGSVEIAEIKSVVRGVDGTPGRLNGRFVTSSGAGEILKNDQSGVYGTLEKVNAQSKCIPVALKQQVKTGKATVLTTLEGTSPKEYEIEIEKISYNEERATKNMVICVTDPELLSKAGGIVQGMSGSPIIQNGRLVGAVSHVFVKDPTRGYAIFAENMLESAQSVGQG